MNNIIITGRLTKDVELRNISETTKVGRFGVAVAARPDKNGEKHVDFFNCQAWNGTADAIAKYLHKGDPVEIMGEMRSATKDDKTYWTLNVKEWHFAQTQAKKDNNGLTEASEEEAENLPF